ncbi:MULTISPECIES: hypothetical protein [unclassified Thiomonas]|jgi:hypothetical protein|uniref:hypothetical protein n=1 Tax=unclassified Thiomonas TaxID=2625466 RepID=UPI00257D4D88|nr:MULTISPECIES: hypothetical protein [unclassified Thiomonas]
MKPRSAGQLHVGAHNTMPLPPPPPNWEANEISKFFDAARTNEFATFANKTGEVARLSEIDLGYRKAIDGVNHSPDWFAGFFLLRAHSNYLAACRLSWSAQIPESYALLRSCLENALYGLYLAKHPESRETWLRRQDDAAAKRKVKDEFKIGTMLNLAAAVDATEGAVAKLLYEQTIDSGAHPNELALMQTLQINKSADRIAFKSNYLDKDSGALSAALKTTAQVGVCALSLFRVIYPGRFNIMGVTDLLRRVKVGL